MTRKTRFVLLASALAGMALASPATAGSLRLMFDIFSPRGITCTAETPADGAARISRGITGNPVIRLTGNVRDARVFCRLPDGSRWQALAPGLLRPGQWAQDALIAVRPGAPSGVTILSSGRRNSEVLQRSFVRRD